MDFVSAVIGFLVGVILMVIIFWILYATRSLTFSQCPSTTRKCLAADYHNDPGDAIVNGTKSEKVLFVNNRGELYYRRPKREAECYPDQGDQVVHIKYPQYCIFTTENGNVMGKQIQRNSPIYRLPEGITVITEGNCVPPIGSMIISGVPSTKWDPNPLS